MPAGQYNPPKGAGVVIYSGRFEERPWIATTNPHMRFVAYQTVGCVLAPTSVGNYRTWLIEGCGHTLAVAKAALMANIRDFLGMNDDVPTEIEA